ncbi:MAG: 30S ribosomal protein S20 [Deltaproteobacteria bacterium]|nr:30S ribosomal protein S20 [Deltaproteobacteria bacterium]
MSARKRVRRNERKRIANRLVLGKVRKAIRDARHAIKTQSSDIAAKVLTAERIIASSATRGVIHKNTASRLIKRLRRAANNFSLTGATV